MQIQPLEIEMNQLVDLSQDELMSTQGGESAWYWIAYGVGSAVRHYQTYVNDDSIPIG